MNKTLQILIIDDDEIDRMTVARALRSSNLDCSVKQAQNGQSGLEQIVSGDFDCILLDYMLPDTDGLTLLRLIRQQDVNIPVIMLTGQDNEALAVQLIRSGAQDYIAKSQISADILTHSIRNALRLFEAEQERSRAVVELRKTSDKISDILESISDAFFAIEDDGRFSYINQQAEFLLDAPRNALVGESIWDAVPGLPDWFRKTLIDTLRKRSGTQCEGQQETTGKWLEVQAYPGSSGVSVYFRDITARKKSEAQLNFLANHDALTNLPNRMLLMDRLKQALTRAPWHKRHVAVLFCDLDRFKVINDTLGHNVGDHLLKIIAERLESCVREGDTVSRLGGDEFVILLSDLARPTDVKRVAQKIISRVSEPIWLESQEVFVGVSIGISIFPDDADGADQLIRQADVAMYQAKRNGKNCYEFYSPELITRGTERLGLESALRRALESNEFELQYQPQIDLDSGQIVGAEALLRWHSQEFGMVSPADFLPIAEETGLILPIGEWVLHQACVDSKVWQEGGHPPLRVAVNISNLQFMQETLPQTVADILSDTRLEARWLELELTENIFLMDTQTAHASLRALREIGVQLSIDDFGTGYTSLVYLKKFPIQTLKIDRSFIQDITRSTHDRIIAETIIAMAKKLDLRVIAEGVEVEEQRDVLVALGCDEMQGFLFSRPLPAGEFESLWHTTRLQHCS